MYGKNSIWDDLKNEFRSGNIISQLIMVNVGVFLLINIVGVIIFLVNADKGLSDKVMSDILSWVMLPAETKQLLRSPWTLITHMFMHYGIWHLLFNMLWLYWFGRIIQEFIGNKKILPLYIYGGLVGASFLIISYNIFPGLHSSLPYIKALGASAGVLAVVVAAATLVPDYTIFLIFFGGVKIKYIAMIMVLIDLVSIPELNTGGHIAHLGGALFGYVFIRQLQNGHDWSIPFNNFLETLKNIVTFKRQPRVVYKTKSGERKKRSVSKSGDQQQQVDEILDKIARSGYDSLSKEEREFLFKVSKEEK